MSLNLLMINGTLEQIARSLMATVRLSTVKLNGIPREIEGLHVFENSFSQSLQFERWGFELEFDWKKKTGNLHFEYSDNDPIRGREKEGIEDKKVHYLPLRYNQYRNPDTYKQEIIQLFLTFSEEEAKKCYEGVAGFEKRNNDINNENIFKRLKRGMQFTIDSLVQHKTPSGVFEDEV